MQNDSIDNLRLDMNKKSIRGVIYVRSGDTRARTIHITLTNNGSVVDLSNAYICELLIKKPDGSENDQAMVRVGNELQYTFRTQDINVPGECKCQVMVTFEDSAEVVSSEFSVMVYQKTIDQSLEQSTNEYTSIQQQLAEANSLRTQAAADADRAESAREGIEDCESRCKTYADNASADASDASNSATSASNSASEASGYVALVKEYRDDAATYCEETRTNLQSVEDKAQEILAYDSSAKDSADNAAISETNAGNSADAAADSEANAATSEENAEAWAKGTKNGTPVPDTDPAYENNAKYYSDLAIATVNNKVDKEAGKGLSSNDFTNTYKDKLDNIESGAEVNVQADWNQSDNTADDYIKNKPSTLGHTIQNPSGTAMTQRANLQFTGNVTMTDDAVNGKTVINVDDSGHTIVDSSGTDMTQRSDLQFVDAFLTDDSVKGKTVVENIKEVAPADYDSTTDEGIIVCDDGEDAVIHPSSDDYVEVTADGVKNIRQLLDELFALCDTSKISNESIITKGNEVYRYQRPFGTNGYMFITLYGQTSSSELDSIIFQATNSRYLEWSYKTSGNTVTEGSTTLILTSGTKITLHYGNKKAVVDLQTKANRCLLNSGETVESALTYTNSAIAIGKFLGRTLYRKVFEYTEVNVPVNTDVKLTGAVGIDSSKIISISTVLRQSGKSTITNSPVLQTYITSSNEMWINQDMSSSYNSATITIIVEYTD